ncbi:MAG: FliM/FliN family flagellar motor switch protein [Candidatus Acidiferrum sp.]|jgi:flagellar motor switch protein FliN/FliY
MEPAARISVQKLCDIWKDCLVSVVESLGAASLAADWTVPLADAVDPAVKDPAKVDSWFVAKGGLQGIVGCRCEKSVAVQFAQLLQSEAANPAAEFNDLQRDAFAEFIRQVAGQVATDWKAESGNAIELVYDAAVLPQLSTAQAASLQIKSDKFSELTLQLFVDAALCAALNTPPAPSPVAGAPAAEAATDPLTSNLAEGPIPNLGLLLDVELEATIRFGQREMLLREVFGLMPGAVVELNQLVNEPAELLVAGRLIARGEVVVVDGNFGLRVTEVAVAGQRAALLEL